MAEGFLLSNGIPTTDKNKLVILDETGKIPVEYIPDGVGGGGGSGFVASDTAPEDTNAIWIDTSNGKSIMKYYNTESSSWTALDSVWG